MRSLSLLVLSAGLVGLSGIWTPVRAGRNDASLFDGTNPANTRSGAVCCGSKDMKKSDQAFTVNVAVANWGGAGEVRLTYVDGDFIRFPLQAGQSFAFSQAAGSRGDKKHPASDTCVRISNGGSAAQLAGVMSAASADGDGPVCLSCDNDSDGPAACNNIIPLP